MLLLVTFFFFSFDEVCNDYVDVPLIQVRVKVFDFMVQILENGHLLITKESYI